MLPPGWPWAGGLLAVLTATPFLVHDSFVLHALLITCLWAGLASAWNILAGFAGQLSFGHAAFLGVGAYTMGILDTTLGVSPWLGMVAGGVVAAALAVAIGVPSFRLRGPYFALATLALAEVVRIVAVYWDGLTGGSSGLLMPIETGLAAVSWAGKGPFLWLTTGYLGVVWLAAAGLRRSRLGYFLAAVREDQEAAAVAGVDPTWAKMQAAMLSAFFTGVGGAILACYLTLVEPDSFLGVQVSTQFLVITIVGGLGTLSGPVIGAFVATPLAEFLRSVIGSEIAGSLHQLIYGISFILVMIFLPRGIAPHLLRGRGLVLLSSKKVVP